MSKEIIELQNLQVSYDDKTVLHNIDLSFYEGRITVILGGSGCGKSTLLKAMLGLKQASKGSVTILGKQLYNLSEREYTALLKDIGVLFQNGALLNSMTLYENVMIPLEQHTALSWELADKLVRIQLHRVGLGQDLFKFPSELSGGMRKRAALARAMILNPRLLFCDEPSAGLDPVTSAQLDELLVALKTQFNMSIVVVTHELASIYRIAEDLIFLDDGHCVFHGSLEAALECQEAAVKEFFEIGHVKEHLS